ncbi:Ig-like domain-containing protein [Zavarzinella formosa]|uniref:Ig-like domain-containing protein n=1 Tax=Zavarzinella formosa TaxID=360055 RepID=UPI00031A3B64|nr:DUF1573 domain-containing protein [Zavarzinella formosa]
MPFEICLSGVMVLLMTPACRVKITAFVIHLFYDAQNIDKIIMKFKLLIAVFAMVAAATCSVVVFYASRRSTAMLPQQHDTIQTEARPVLLKINDQELELGEVWQGQNISRILHVENISAEQVRVSGWTTSCDCQSVLPDKLIIAPGETVAIKLVIAAKSPHLQEEEISPVSYAISPIFEPRDLVCDKHEWTFSGKVRKICETQGDKNFGYHSELSQPLPKSDFAAKFFVPVGSVNASCDSSYVEAKVRMAGDGSGVCNVDLLWHEKLPKGSHNFVVKLHSKTTEGSPLPAVEIPCKITIASDVRLSQTRIAIESKNKSKPVREIISAFSMRGNNAKITDVSRAPEKWKMTSSVDPVSGCLVVEPEAGTSPEAGSFDLQVTVECDTIKTILPLTINIH